MRMGLPKVIISDQGTAFSLHLSTYNVGGRLVI